ncbi:unnamed protein product, partial [Closterium sp. Naga37s-1]
FTCPLDCVCFCTLLWGGCCGDGTRVCTRILGDTFLMAYHSIFHFGKPMRVGFATSR